MHCYKIVNPFIVLLDSSLMQNLFFSDHKLDLRMWFETVRELLRQPISKPVTLGTFQKLKM